jgi:hypothetical protein
MGSRDGWSILRKTAKKSGASTPSALILARSSSDVGAKTDRAEEPELQLAEKGEGEEADEEADEDEEPRCKRCEQCLAYKTALHAQLELMERALPSMEAGLAKLKKAVCKWVKVQLKDPNVGRLVASELLEEVVTSLRQPGAPDPALWDTLAEQVAEDALVPLWLVEGLDISVAAWGARLREIHGGGVSAAAAAAATDATAATAATAAATAPATAATATATATTTATAAAVKHTHYFQMEAALELSNSTVKPCLGVQLKQLPVRGTVAPATKKEEAITARRDKMTLMVHSHSSSSLKRSRRKRRIRTMVPKQSVGEEANSDTSEDDFLADALAVESASSDGTAGGGDSNVSSGDDDGDVPGNLYGAKANRKLLKSLKSVAANKRRSSQVSKELVAVPRFDAKHKFKDLQAYEVFALKAM